jgi:hypothetical protein
MASVPGPDAAAGAPLRPATAVVASLHAMVQSKRVSASPREVVEELRQLSLHPPCPGVLPALLGALRQLRANKKAGEENKVIRAIYAAVAALAAADLLTDGDAAAVVSQLLSHDVRDDALPRQLAALQLAADLAGRFPGADGA